MRYQSLNSAYKENLKFVLKNSELSMMAFFYTSTMCPCFYFLLVIRE